MLNIDFMYINWIEKLTANQQVGGSSPPGIAIIFSFSRHPITPGASH